MFISGSRYSTGCCAPAFAGGRWWPQAPKGGKRPKAANHRHAIPPDESKGIQPEPAGSMKLEADCLHLCPQRLLPAYWYLGAFLTLTALTEILRLRLRMTMRAGRQYRNAGSFLRKELGEALRIGLNLFSERPDAPILRRLRRHLLPKEGGYGTSSCGTGDTNVNSVTLTSYSSPRSGDTTTLAAVGCVKPKNLKNLRAEGPSTLTPQACHSRSTYP